MTNMIKPETPVSLPVSLVNQVLVYLSGKPYAEVYALIASIQTEVEPQLRQTAQPPAETE